MMTRGAASIEATGLGGDTIHVGMCADNGFALTLAAALTSIARHADGGDRLTIYVIDGGLDPTARAKLGDVARRCGPAVTVRWIEPDGSRLAGLRGMGRLPVASYLRLLLPEAVPDEVHKLIYLDGDLIVRSSLRPVWETDLNDCVLAAAADRMTGAPPAELLQAMGIDDWPYPYVNSGVMVIDLARWRRDGVADQMFEFIRRYNDQIRWADQDAINGVLRGDIAPLPPEWNRQYLVMLEGDPDRRRSLWPGPPRELSSCRIVHFAGHKKPWEVGPYDADRREFIRSLYRSGYLPRRRVIGLWLRCVFDRVRVWRREVLGSNRQRRGVGLSEPSP